MKLKTFYLFLAINRNGLNTSQWGIDLFLDIAYTKGYYGTKEDIMLESGVWVSVYVEDEDNLFFQNLAKPDLTLHYHDDSYLLLYKITD